jgi:UDP-glucose 4-epimerase
LDLLGRIKNTLGSNIEPIHEAARSGDVRDSQASIEAAKAGLGYKVLVDFDEGLRRTVEWHRDNTR